MMAYGHHHAYPGYPPYAGMSPGMPGVSPPHMGGYYPPQWPPSDASVIPDPETEKKLVKIEELMKNQSLDFEKAKSELAARDKAEADAKAAAAAAKKEAEEKMAWEKKLAEEKAAAEKKYKEDTEAAEKKYKEDKEAWEKKIEEEKKAAQKQGAENAKKQIEAERKKLEQQALEEKERADTLAKIKKLTEDAAADQKKLRDEAAAEQKKFKEEAAAEAEKTKKAHEEAMKALAKPAVEKKKPIKFKDAVGRKFSFPFELCATWGGMEELIRQAFLHVDAIGPHVMDGHYDLLGPNGEIILPQIWETTIEPDWSITMHMWPIPEPRPPPIPIPSFDPGRPKSGHGHRHSRGPPPGPPPPGHRGGPPPPPANWPGGPPPPRPGGGGGGPPNPMIIPVSPLPSRKKSSKGASKSVFDWMAGSKSKPSGKARRPKKS